MSQPRHQPYLLSIIAADPLGGERLVGMLSQLRELRLSLPFEVIAVFGGPDRSPLAALQREFPLVTVLYAEEASPWSKGCEAATGRYVLMLDGSAKPSAALIDGMILAMEKGPWVAAIGPRLVSPSGTDRVSALAFPSLGSAIADLRGRRGLPAAIAPRLPNRFDRQVTTPKEVDALAPGCCMIKRRTFQEIGGWDSGFLAGGEALDWCQRARQKGWSMLYHPGLVAELAQEDTDDPRLLAARLVSACRFIRRYRGFWTLTALKLLLALLSLHGMLHEGGASLIPGTHRPNARSAFRRAVLVLGSLIAPQRWLPA